MVNVHWWGEFQGGSKRATAGSQCDCPMQMASTSARAGSSCGAVVLTSTRREGLQPDGAGVGGRMGGGRTGVSVAYSVDCKQHLTHWKSRNL